MVGEWRRGSEGSNPTVCSGIELLVRGGGAARHSDAAALGGRRRLPGWLLGHTPLPAVPWPGEGMQGEHRNVQAYDL